MKRNIVLAALATLTAGTAMAQSSVTLYGRVNETVERIKVGGDKTTQLRSNTSFWGMKGVEDLGGGLKASFLLEAAFNADTGAGNAQGGTFFGRESWVAIGSDSLGRVRLGNMSSSAFYYATADYVGLHNHDTGTSSDAFFLYTGSPKNMIAYDSPTIAGFRAEAQFAFRSDSSFNEVNTGSKHTSVFRVDYDMGALHLGAGYLKGPVTADSVVLPFVPGMADITDTTGYGFRALVELGDFTVGGYVNRDELDGAARNYKRTSYRAVGKYTLGANDFHLDVGRAGKFSGLSDSAATQYTIAWNYNLSKRTKLYTFYTHVKNDDNATYNTGIAGANFSSFAVGIRHWF